MNHNEFKAKWLNKWYAENTAYWFQCVAWVKKYCSEVYWVNLSSFWGTAYNWFMSWSPFIWKWFTKILNTKEFVPKTWDIIFFDKAKSNWMCGHVGIVDEWSTAKTVKVLNQNMGTWTGQSTTDYFRISNFDYITPKCLGVYRKN